jgi:hypothetical protein
MGSTLGAALFASLLIARFVPEVQAALPVGLLQEGSGLATVVRDPQALLDPAAADALRASVVAAFPTAPERSELVLDSIRAGLAAALQWVFAAAALISLGGLVGSLLWRDVSMHRGRTAPSSSLR